MEIECGEGKGVQVRVGMVSLSAEEPVAKWATVKGSSVVVLGMSIWVKQELMGDKAQGGVARRSTQGFWDVDSGLSERIREHNAGIERLAQDSYPQIARLKQVKGVGTLIALTSLLRLEHAHRFLKSLRGLDGVGGAQHQGMLDSIL